MTNLGALASNATIPASALGDDVLPLGSIIDWYRVTTATTVPAGWAVCDGALWNDLDNQMGSSKAKLTTGNIPNLIGKVTVGARLTTTAGGLTAADGTASANGDAYANAPGIGGTGGSNAAINLAHTHQIPGHGHAHTIATSGASANVTVVSNTTGVTTVANNASITVQPNTTGITTVGAKANVTSAENNGATNNITSYNGTGLTVNQETPTATYTGDHNHTYTDDYPNTSTGPLGAYTRVTGIVYYSTTTSYTGGHTHPVPHGHGVTDPSHAHTIYQTNHSHGITDPSHAHTITQTTHAHTVTDPGHAHTLTQTNHSHAVTGTVGINTTGDSAITTNTLAWTSAVTDVRPAHVGLLKIMKVKIV